MKATTLCFVTLFAPTKGAFIPSSHKVLLKSQSNGRPALNKPDVVSYGTSQTCHHLHPNHIIISQAYSVSDINGHITSVKAMPKEESGDHIALSSIRRRVLWNTVLFPSLPVSVANAIDISSQATSTEKQESPPEDPFASFGKSLKSNPSLSSLETPPPSSVQTNKNVDNQLDGPSPSASSQSLDDALKAKSKKRVIDPRTHG